MVDQMKKMLLEECISDVVCDFVTITSGDDILRLTSNTEDLQVWGRLYTADSFDFAPGDIHSSESACTLKVTDIQRRLVRLVQEAEEKITVEVFSMCLADLENELDGPYVFIVKSAQVSSATQEVTLSLGRESALGYNVSVRSYNNRLFPGLF